MYDFLGKLLTHTRTRQMIDCPITDAVRGRDDGDEDPHQIGDIADGDQIVLAAVAGRPGKCTGICWVVECLSRTRICANGVFLLLLCILCLFNNLPCLCKQRIWMICEVHA